MRAILIASAVATMFATAAVADDSALASRYGNTTITKDAAGHETHLYYAADGTFSGKQGDVAFKGTWKIDGGTICLASTPAIPITTVQKMTGAISILMSLMKPSPRGCILMAAGGSRAPSSTPSAMAMRT